MVTINSNDDFDPKLDELLRLPRFSPSQDFSDRVMSQVAVFQHQRAAARIPVAAPVVRRSIDVAKPEFAIPPAIARWIPASRPARYALGAFAAVTSVATTAAAAILAANLSLASFVGGLALDRMIAGMAVGTAGFINGALGPNVVGYFNSGSAEGALMMGGLAAGGVAALAGLKKASSLNARTI
jgi:hypothetical protein